MHWYRDWCAGNLVESVLESTDMERDGSRTGWRKKLGCDAEDSASPWGSSEIGVSPSALSQPGAPPAGLLLPVPQRKEEKIGKRTPFRWVLLEKADSWSPHHSQQLGNKSIMSKAGSEWCIVAAMILPHFFCWCFSRIIFSWTFHQNKFLNLLGYDCIVDDSIEPMISQFPFLAVFHLINSYLLFNHQSNVISVKSLNFY